MVEVPPKAGSNTGLGHGVGCDGCDGCLSKSLKLLPVSASSLFFFPSAARMSHLRAYLSWGVHFIMRQEVNSVVVSH